MSNLESANGVTAISPWLAMVNYFNQLILVQWITVKDFQYRTHLRSLLEM